MNGKRLTAQEIRFKERYLLTGKVVESALYAKYAPSTAKTKAFTWVSDSKCPANKRHLLEAIREAQRERSEKTKVDAEWILTELQVQYELAKGEGDRPNALRALDLAGKHVDVQAYKDKVDIVHRMTHEEALESLEHGSDSAEHHTAH
jgi:phage terminase small subunit